MKTTLKSQSLYTYFSNIWKACKRQRKEALKCFSKNNGKSSPLNNITAVTLGFASKAFLYFRKYNKIQSGKYTEQLHSICNTMLLFKFP